MKIARYPIKLSEVPVDFFADPDGDWTYEALVSASGFDPELQTICIGALTAPFRDHVAGSAVVTIAERRGRCVVIADCSSADVGASSSALGVNAAITIAQVA